MHTTEEPGACDSPVFILTASRSGSTLLRFILDSHPEFACPPETSIASVCAGLARTWDILESAGSGTGRPVNDPVPLPGLAAAAVREAIDRVYGRYLQRRGKRRWCDKSLDSFQFADLITQVYPDAKFICLFRHCMDVIASGVEVCPWGLHRFGFDPFVAQYPGNSVAAIGGYWLSVSQATVAFADKHPEMCHRVRYEDLVTAPEDTAAAIFSFLGATQVPGITEDSFRTPHEGEGPGDEKIWFTPGVLPDSVGRGVSVPSGALPSPLRSAINEVLAGLGYRQVDDQWNAALGRPDPRADAPHPAGGAIIGTSTSDTDLHELAAAVRGLTSRIEEGLSQLPEIGERWPALTGATVTLVIQSPVGRYEEFRVTFSPTPAAEATGTAAAATEIAEPVAQLVAHSATWQALLEGQANIVTEVHAGRLRCLNKRDGHRIRSDELHAIATLLRMATIPMARYA